MTPPARPNPKMVPTAYIVYHGTFWKFMKNKSIQIIIWKYLLIWNQTEIFCIYSNFSEMMMVFLLSAVRIITVDHAYQATQPLQPILVYIEPMGHSLKSLLNWNYLLNWTKHWLNGNKISLFQNYNLTCKNNIGVYSIFIRNFSCFARW